MTLQGIYVGPVAADVVPQVDRVFAFEDAEAALTRADHFGKLVVRIGG